MGRESADPPPDNAQIAQATGRILLRQADYAGAVAQFARAVRLGVDPKTIAPILNDHGASLASRSRAQEAEPLIRKAIEFDPGLVQARRNLVLVLLDQGRMAEARDSLDNAIRATGPRPEYRDLLPRR